MTTQPDYWNQLYRAEARPGWDMDGATPLVRELLGLALPLGLRAGGDLVVPGCGYGHDAAELEARGFAVTGLDFAPLAIQGARQRYGDRVAWSQADWFTTELGPVGPVSATPRAALGAPGGSSQERRGEHSGSTRSEPDAAGCRPPPQPRRTMPGGRSAASAPLDDEPHRPAGPSLRSIPPDVVAAHGGAGTGPWDAIFDHTCFVAMDPIRRPAYVEACAAHLRSGGLWLAALFHDVNGRPGPPHALPMAEMRALAEAHFEVLHLAAALDSHPRRAGREYLMVARKR